ncbi:hypothetical protein ACWCXX_11030 [Streptomyces sp. NPDC001732]
MTVSDAGRSWLLDSVIGVALAWEESPAAAARRLDALPRGATQREVLRLEADHRGRRYGLGLLCPGVLGGDGVPAGPGKPGGGEDPGSSGEPARGQWVPVQIVGMHLLQWMHGERTCGRSLIRFTGSGSRRRARAMATYSKPFATARSTVARRVMPPSRISGRLGAALNRRAGRRA